MFYSPKQGLCMGYMASDVFSLGNPIVKSLSDIIALPDAIWP